VLGRRGEAYPKIVALTSPMFALDERIGPKKRGTLYDSRLPPTLTEIFFDRRGCINVRTALHSLGKKLLRAAGASCFLWATTVFGFAFVQQGEFVPAKPAAVKQQVPALQHSVALAAFPQQNTKTPDLIKRSLHDAQNILQESKLLMGSPQFVASPAPPGTVLRQYPGAGSPIKIGATVLVWVSAEQPKRSPPPLPPAQQQPDYVSVPELIGLNAAQARQLLDKYRLSMGAISQIASNDQRPGLIISQDPVAKSGVATGTPVSISVATPKLISVPSLIHHQKDDAIQILQLVGLHFRPADIRETLSEEETGIVLSQDPAAETLVTPGTSVSFTVSQQIARKLLLRASPRNLSPGESVVLSAELDPPFPGAEYQFSLGGGTEPSGAWSTDAEAQVSNLGDGNYEAVAAARWNNRSVVSNRVRIVVHSIKYDVSLIPKPRFPKSGDTVSFDAELSPAVEKATYIFHFGDGIEDQTSSSPHAQYTYQSAGNYSTQVTVRFSDTTAAGGPAHSHDFTSRSVQLTVEPRPPILFYVLGVAVLAGVGYAMWKWLGPKPRVDVVIHKDLGVQTIEVARRARKREGIEIHVVRSWGEQTIESKGPLWARIETIHE